MGRNAIETEIGRVQSRLADLATERSTLEARLAVLRDELARTDQDELPLIPPADALTNASPPAGKLALFRRLFAGRPDVFPVRWENAKTGRAGYSPACANEWVRNICAKPRVKCGECPHQKFIPVSDDVVARHLRGGDRRNGDFVAGWIGDGEGPRRDGVPTVGRGEHLCRAKVRTETARETYSFLRVPAARKDDPPDVTQRLERTRGFCRACRQQECQGRTQDQHNRIEPWISHVPSVRPPSFGIETYPQMHYPGPKRTLQMHGS